MIHQKISFTGSTSAWFNFYLDSKEHAAVLDDRVTISRKVGARFTASSGMLRERNLTIVTHWFIVPSWRFYPRAGDYATQAKGASGIKTMINVTNMMEATVSKATGGKGVDPAAFDDLHN